MKKFLFIASIAALFAVSCAKENGNTVPDDSHDGVRVHLSIKGGVAPTKTGVINVDKSYLPYWNYGDQISAFFDSFGSKTKVDATIANTATEGSDKADFDGDVTLNNGTVLSEQGVVYSFYPASALNNNDIVAAEKAVRINLKGTQNPAGVDTYDPEADILVGQPSDYMYDAEDGLISTIAFSRVMSVVRVNLKAANDCPQNLAVSSFRMTAPAGTVLTGRAKVSLAALYGEDNAIKDWSIKNNFVAAEYSSDFNPYVGGADDSNTIYVIVNPTTITAGGNLTFSLVASDGENTYDIEKQVTLPKAIDFPQGNVAVINLTIANENCQIRIPETRLIYEDFHGVTANKEKSTPEQTGVIGLGVNEGLTYTYDGDNTNVRNTNGQSNGDFSLFFSVASNSFTICNIANVNGATDIKIEAKLRTANFLTVTYKSSDAQEWSNGGTLSHGGTGWDDVATGFKLPDNTESFDVCFTASNSLNLDDIAIFEGIYEVPSTLATDVVDNTIVLGGNSGSSVTFNVTGNYEWLAVTDGSGFTIDPEMGDANKTTEVTVTASADGSTTEEKILGTITVSDYHADDIVITVKQAKKILATTDVLNQTVTGVTGSSYTTFSNKTSNTGVVYAGYCAGSNSSIQLKAELANGNYPGVVTTANTTGLVAQKATIVWESHTTSGRTLNVYGSHTAYTSSDDLNDNDKKGTLIGTIKCGTSTELNLGDEYEYVAFASASGAMYLTSITIDWDTAKEPLSQTANLSIDGNTMSWDAVENADKYLVKIGNADAVECLTNSMDISEVTPEFYSISIVAVDTDGIYANSPAKVFADVKIGNPVLGAPVLNAGAIDEESITINWANDPKASNGYSCEIYQGSTKVQGPVDATINGTSASVKFSGLDEAVEYTIKVVAKAAGGYGASEVASITRTTVAASHVSSITVAGTYTIKGLTVYAVPATNTAIVGDNTGKVLVYAKDGHGLVAGDTFDINGAVEKYNGVWEFKEAQITNIDNGTAPSHGSPVSVDASFCSAYVSAPGIQYVTLTGIQSGRTITIGSQAFYLSATNAETDGYEVTVTGYAYGYYTNNSSISLYASSIVENPSAASYAITSNAGANGSISIKVDGNTATTAKAGHSVTVTVSPNENHRVATFTVDGQDCTLDNNKQYTFKMPAKAVTVAATFEEEGQGGDETTTVTWVASEQGYTNGVKYTSATVDSNILLAFGDGENDGKYYDTGTGIRLYAEGKMTVSAANDAIIKELVITYSASGYAGTFSASTGSYQLSSATGTWTGSASSVVLTNTATSGHARIQKVVVKYTGGSSSDSDPVNASWSVSPASVTVDKDKTATATITTDYDGTLSVTSNAEGTATATISGKEITVTGVSKGSTTLTVTGPATSKYNAISKTINVTVNEGGSTTPVTLKLTNIGSNTSSTNVTVKTTTSVTATGASTASYTLNYYQGKKQGNAILLTKSIGAYISNNTPIPGSIKSVTVYINSGASGKTTYHCAFKTTECTEAYTTGSTAVNITGGNSNKYTCSVVNASYFCISLGNANNGQVLSIDVEYVPNN